jgi:hypothetical protein
MRIREITTPVPLYEAESFNSMLDKAVAEYMKKKNITVPSKVESFLRVLKKTTYAAALVVPIYKYYANVEVIKDRYKNNPAEIASRTQLEEGILTTTVLGQVSTILGGEILLFFLAELFGAIPIVGLLLVRILQALAPAASAMLAGWLGSEGGRSFIVNLVHVQNLQDIPGYASDLVATFKNGISWCIGKAEEAAGVDIPFIGPDHKPVDPNAPKPDSTTTPADPNAPKPDSTTTPADPNAPKPDVKPSATPTDPNDPWAIKSNTPPVYPKKPTELKKIVASTDDSAYTTWDRVKRGPNGQLQLK